MTPGAWELGQWHMELPDTVDKRTMGGVQVRNAMRPRAEMRSATQMVACGNVKTVELARNGIMMMVSWGKGITASTKMAIE